MSALSHFHGYFDPLRHKGGDVASVACPEGTTAYFDPLRRKGGDGKSIAFPRLPLNFDPLRRKDGDETYRAINRAIEISIHSAARTETNGPNISVAQTGFRSTPPQGRRLKGEEESQNIFEISIHSAARTETAKSHKIYPKNLFTLTKFSHFLKYFLNANLLYLGTFKCFMHFFWCESPGDFMGTSDSHLHKVPYK